MSGSVRYEKNWLRKERSAQEKRPKNHIRKVHTGRVGSSVLVTVSLTSSMGEISSSLRSRFFSRSVVAAAVVVVRYGVSSCNVPMVSVRYLKMMVSWGGVL